MKTVDCPRLCETCPIRNYIEGEPVTMTETAYELRVEAVVDPITKENVYAYDFVNGMPTTKRLSTIAIANEIGKKGFRFQAKGEDWDSGQTVKEFEDCQGPSQIKSGFLNLKRLTVCSALKNIE